MLNKYLWQLYLDSGGKAVVKMFEDNFTGKFTKSFIKKITESYKVWNPFCELWKDVEYQLNDLYEFIKKDTDGIIKGFRDENGFDVLLSIVCEDNMSAKDTFTGFIGSMAYYTTLLAVAEPDLYIPYYFTWNFNIVEKIAEEFDIDLPALPPKKDYEGRTYYYCALCVAFHKFADENDLSSFELFAFMYDFAPKYVGGYKSYIIDELPEPRSAYFIGADANDTFLDDKDDHISVWQCNPDTRAGDMIVMYKRTPISAADSVWRSISVGFNDPFFYYYRCTYIGHRRKIQPVTKKVMEKDKILKEMPIVRKNMQGINGVEFLPSQYDRILELGKADSSILRLDFGTSGTDEEFLLEKDVENKLIKPLIKRLDYQDDEYTTQLVIGVGNHNTLLIPDFVMLPVKRSGHITAFAVIEAKLEITSGKMLDETKQQVRSYARQLNAQYTVICDKKKLHVMSMKDDFSEDIYECTWAEANKADVFSKLYRLIGRTNKRIRKEK